MPVTWPRASGPVEAARHGGKHVVEQSCSPHGGKEAREKRLTYIPQSPPRSYPSHLKFPTRPHLLKAPLPPNECRAGD